MDFISLCVCPLYFEVGRMSDLESRLTRHSQILEPTRDDEFVLLLAASIVATVLITRTFSFSLSHISGPEFVGTLLGILSQFPPESTPSESSVAESFESYELGNPLAIQPPETTVEALAGEGVEEPHARHGSHNNMGNYSSTAAHEEPLHFTPISLPGQAEGTLLAPAEAHHPQVFDLSCMGGEYCQDFLAKVGDYGVQNATETEYVHFSLFHTQ